jgi:predicted alpha/beta-hydrolase family hydrolase
VSAVLPETVQAFKSPGVQGFLHRPLCVARGAIAISHGAGSNCESPLLVALSQAFAARGFFALRFNLPFRQQRRTGPPLHSADQDREGIRDAAAALRESAPGVPLYLAGHSYGGRMTSMLAAEDAGAADSLLLLSYPLHPVKQPAKLRVEHFPSLRTPALFVHGTRDRFGSIEELSRALGRIPAHTKLIPVGSAGHGLPPLAAPQIAEWFVQFVTTSRR